MFLQVNFFSGEKKTIVNKKTTGAPQILPNGDKRPVSTAVASERRDFEGSLPYTNSSRHLGTAVKQLTPTDLHSPLVSSKSSSGSNASASSYQLKRNLGGNNSTVWENWLAVKNVVNGVTVVALLGCIMLFTFKLSGRESSKIGNTSKSFSCPQNWETSSISWTSDSSRKYNKGHSCTEGNGIISRVQELVSMVKMRSSDQLEGSYAKSSCLSDGPSKSLTAEIRREMPLEEAEALVKYWQAIKAEAFGPNHQVKSLSEALDESMLAQVNFM